MLLLLDDILHLSKEYGTGITALLENSPSMEVPLRLQNKADLGKVLEDIDKSKEEVYDKIRTLLSHFLIVVLLPRHKRQGDMTIGYYETLTAEMFAPSDEVTATEAKRLTDIKMKVEYKLTRLRPDRISASLVPTSRTRLEDILHLCEE